jgi:F-type H+-transporting ATPase subunit alpha
MPVEQQVVIIYAATKKYLLDVPTDEVLDFEKGLFEFIDTQYPELFAKIRDEKKLTDEIEEMLQKAIVEFKEQR